MLTNLSSRFWGPKAPILAKIAVFQPLTCSATVANLGLDVTEGYRLLRHRRQVTLPNLVTRMAIKYKVSGLATWVGYQIKAHFKALLSDVV